MSCPACGPSTFGEVCPATGGARCSECHSVVVPDTAGLCLCGCGNFTALARQTERKRGYVKGDPMRYLPGHATRTVKSAGYPEVLVGKRPSRVHVVVAERALGHALPKGAAVHHVDGDIHNNAPGNLVICESAAYHNLLHRRQRALAACGHAGWVLCRYCHQYDDPARMARIATRNAYYHRECRRAAERKPVVIPSFGEEDGA